MGYQLDYIAKLILNKRAGLVGDGILRPIHKANAIQHPAVINSQAITDHLSLLTDQDYDFEYIDEDDTRVLVKDNTRVSIEDLNPIHPYEAEIQFFRYLQGACLIAENIRDENIESEIKHLLNNIYKLFCEKIGGCVTTAAKCQLILDLVAKMGDVLAFHIYPVESDKESKKNKDHIESVMKQITMARDLAILLTRKPAVLTVSPLLSSNKITVEKATIEYIGQDYYEEPSIFGDPVNQSWMYSAKKRAGLLSKVGPTWLENFFTNHLGELKVGGMPATPSSRWLPIPANVQHMELMTAVYDKEELRVESYNDYTRAGVVVPYDIRTHLEEKKPYDYQKELATASLKAIIRSRLRAQIDRFKQNYHIQDGESFDFPIHYQTLLSPLLGEKRLDHADNNARFVETAKLVALELDQDEAFKSEFADTGAKLTIYHTNAAINRNAPFTTKESADSEAILLRIKIFNEFESSLRKKYGENYENLNDKPWVVNELEVRKKASAILEDLLSSPRKYFRLKEYQYNLFVAALDHLLMGSQGLSIDGCKSSRDRTGVFACAVKTMLENLESMEDWKLLEAGIVTSLLQGHNFRCMSYHSGVVKVDLVHKDFMEALDKPIQSDIKNLLVFSKEIKADKSNKRVGNQSFLVDDVHRVAPDAMIDMSVATASKISISVPAFIRVVKFVASVIAGGLLGAGVGSLLGLIIAPFTAGLSFPIFLGVGFLLGAIFLSGPLRNTGPAEMKKVAAVETKSRSRSSYAEYLGPVIGPRQSPDVSSRRCGNDKDKGEVSSDEEKMSSDLTAAVPSGNRHGIGHHSNH